MDELTNQQIAVGLRAGDRKAWDALCDRFGRRIWHYAARLVGSDSEAVADVFQETMLAVARAGRNLDAGAHLWAWLARIAHNQAALYWRGHYRRSAGQAHAGLVDPSADNVFEWLGRQETSAAVREILAEMSGDYVAVLIARYVDDLSIADMVGQIGGTADSVKSRLARARRDFRERCERRLKDVEPVRPHRGKGVE